MTTQFRPVMVSEMVNQPGTRIWTKQVKGTAKFHKWGCACEEYESGGVGYSVAIVEFPDGTIDSIMPNMIQFSDRGTA